jgi:uncharacterized protein with HEPN domain
VRADCDRLLDISEAIDKIEKYAAGGKDPFLQDELLQVWIVHHIQIIGEAATNLSQDLRQRYAETPWADVISMRNVLVHQYFGIDLEVVIRESDSGGEVEVLGFIYPQEDPAYGWKPYRHEGYLASVDSIEALTGLDLLTGIGEGGQREMESVRLEQLWPVEGEYFTEGCKGSRSPVAALGL